MSWFTHFLIGLVASVGATIPLALAEGNSVPERAENIEEELRIPTSKTREVFGTLLLPSGQRGDAVLVLLSGSGAHDRNNTAFGRGIFGDLAKDLANRGLGSYRYDFRGYGKSPGKVASTAREDALDAQKVVAHLRKLKRTKAARIGVLGFSEGGLIASILLALPGEQPDFVIALNTALEPMSKVLPAQAFALPRAAGATEQAAARNASYSRRMIEIAQREPSAEREQDLKREIEAIRMETGETTRWANFQYAYLVAPRTQFSLNYDPLPPFGKTRLPVLFIWAERDIQVDASRSLQRLSELPASNKRSTAVMPGLNHLFRLSATGSAKEYAANPGPMAEEMVDKVARWVETPAQ